MAGENKRAWHTFVYELIGTFILVSTICFIVTGNTGFRSALTRDRVKAQAEVKDAKTGKVTTEAKAAYYTGEYYAADSKVPDLYVKTTDKASLVYQEELMDTNGQVGAAGVPKSDYKLVKDGFKGMVKAVYGDRGSGGLTFAYMIPIGLFIAVTLGANVSGACFNPAVTFAVELSGLNDGVKDRDSEGGHVTFPKCNWVSILGKYWLPQVLGACLAQFCAGVLLGSAVLNGDGSGSGKPGKAGVYVAPQGLGSNSDYTYSIIQVMLAEAWGTFLFTMCILSVCGGKSSNCGGGVDRQGGLRNAGFAHYSLCGALVLAIYVVGPISGGGMNPAVATGLNLMNGLMGPAKKGTGVASPIGVLWAYWVGPLLGATMSGLLYRYHTHHCCCTAVDFSNASLGEGLMEGLMPKVRDNVRGFENSVSNKVDEIGHKVKDTYNKDVELHVNVTDKNYY